MAKESTYPTASPALGDFLRLITDPSGTPATNNFEISAESIFELIKLWANPQAAPHIGAYSNQAQGVIEHDNTAYIYIEDGEVRIVSDSGDLPVTTGIKILLIDKVEPDLEIENINGYQFSVLSGDNDKVDPDDNIGVIKNLCQPIGCYSPRTIISPGVI